ncbi:MAG: hypothetical protein V7700_11790 [Halioglobus sp.]
MMTTHSNPVVTEIPEEAYKQNTIYRPWVDIKAAETTEAAIHNILGHDSRQGVQPDHG